MSQPTEHDDTDEETYEELEERAITADQLVAYNMAVYRMAAGMSQETLAALLTDFTGKHWSKASVSAAERSYHGERTKLFPADQLVALSVVLGVPVNALLLPPMDDGGLYRYVILRDPENRWSMSMLDLLGSLFPRTDAEGEPIQLYWSRVAAAFQFHLGTTAYNDLDDPREVPNLRTSLDHLEQQRAALLSIARDMDYRIEQVRTRMQRNEEEGDEES